MQPLWKQFGDSSKKLKIELPYNPAIALLGIYLMNTKTLIRREICTPMFIAAFFTIAKIWKQPRCPSIGEWINEWIKKMCHIYIYNGILLSHKRE